MALEKKTVVNISGVIGEYKIVQVETVTIVEEDGEEITRSTHGHALPPSTKTDGVWGDTDVSGEDATVQAVCAAVWTESVKTAYQNKMDSIA